MPKGSAQFTGLVAVRGTAEPASTPRALPIINSLVIWLVEARYLARTHCGLKAMLRNAYVIACVDYGDNSKTGSTWFA